MYKVGICGHFGIGYDFADGQTTKTKAVYKALVNSLGEENVAVLDTYGWRKDPVRMINRCRKLLGECENVIMMPAQRGVRVFPAVFNVLNKSFGRKLHYIVIGGWLADELKASAFLMRPIKKLDRVYVEAEKMRDDLHALGVTNAVYMPNFRVKNILQPSELVYSSSEPYRVCTFSRVLKEKGIEDAIEAVRYVNSHFGRTVCTLDIFGMIEPEYGERFEELQQGFEPFISYKGIVANDRSTDELKSCFAVLFPTYYEGEGMAGTIIDAFAAGVPVIATDWHYNSAIIRHLTDGIIYDRTKQGLLGKILLEMSQSPQKLNSLKLNCIEQAVHFESGEVCRILLEGLGVSVEREAETV
ncbi:MAG: glycosyltransferase [Clostridia bacterium]|nr:glycosyltransferase [Clostridia bacterium]